MRNQRRKLYPDLFEAFSLLLKKVDSPEKYFLYCHTSYPDMGWDIPELLQQYNLSSKVYFTYVCGDTRKPFPSLFRGAVAESPYSGKFTATLANVKNGIDYAELSSIINLFDLYVQYANCEGFGLPQVEAAAFGGIPITPKALYKELETGCLRAVPDNELAAEKFFEFFQKPKNIRKTLGFKTRQAFLEHFQWNKSGKKWEDYFDSIEIIPDKSGWLSPPMLNQPKPKPQSIENIKHDDLAKWLIKEVLCEPDKINSFMQARLTRDLLYGCSNSTTGGMYFNESSASFDGKNMRNPFNFDMAYDHFVSLCQRKNYWENRRKQKFNIE